MAGKGSVRSAAPVALLVLGMHRSGTSALTRVLNLLGVELGDRLMPAGDDNPLGFWEHADVVAVLADPQVQEKFATFAFQPTPWPVPQMQQFYKTKAAQARRRSRGHSHCKNRPASKQ